MHFFLQLNSLLIFSKSLLDRNNLEYQIYHLVSNTYTAAEANCISIVQRIAPTVPTA